MWHRGTRLSDATYVWRMGRCDVVKRSTAINPMESASSPEPEQEQHSPPAPTSVIPTRLPQPLVQWRAEDVVRWVIVDACTMCMRSVNIGAVRRDFV